MDEAGEKGSAALSLSGETDGPGKGSTALSPSALLWRLFPPTLSWSHYLVLLRVHNDQARSFYEIEAARESWSVRELERQVAALLFERLSMSRDKEQVLALARQGHLPPMSQADCSSPEPGYHLLWGARSASRLPRKGFKGIAPKINSGVRGRWESSS